LSLPCPTCPDPISCAHNGCENVCVTCSPTGECQRPECCLLDAVPEGGLLSRVNTSPETRSVEYLDIVEAGAALARESYEMHFEKAEHLATGAIRSDASGKGRYDLIPPLALRRVAVVYERGGEQKGDNNWMLGVPRTRLLSSALRHTYQAVNGDTDEDHLAHAVWNLLAAIHFEEAERG
jgi:hypothetical protein